MVLSALNSNTSSGLQALVDQARQLSPKRPGECDILEAGEVESFVMSAQLWEQAAESFKHSSQYACASACYIKAATSLQSARYLGVTTRGQSEIWNWVDDRIEKLFKKALAVDTQVDTSKLSPYWQAKAKKGSLRTLQTLYWHLKSGEHPDAEKIERYRDKVCRKAKKLADAFEKMAPKKSSQMDDRAWRSLMHQAHCLLIAGRFSPNPQGKETILLKAEAIGKKILRECESAMNYAEFNPQHSRWVEETVLGQIQIELVHYMQYLVGSGAVVCTRVNR